MSIGVRGALVLSALLFGPGCQRETGSAGQTARQAAGQIAPPQAAPLAKPVSFAILDHYDKGEDLNTIGQDFKLMRELGLSELRCSFGWDDFEPERGKYDFVWLKQFCEVAREHGIRVRPYIGYTPKWAGAPGSDDQDWNNPPADMETWRKFVFNLVSELKDQPNVLSYEIYNEENARFRWDGSINQYMETLRVGSEAVRAANPKANVLIGGFVFPDANWMSAIAGAGLGKSYDIVAFHAYPETWSEAGVTVENYLAGDYKTSFVAHAQGKPIWINEMGFATSSGKSEEQQANWFARAVSTFLADPHVQHIGVYELKDSKPDSPVPGEKENHSMGLIRGNGQKKMAFDTVKLLVKLLNTGTLSVVDDEANVRVSSGVAGELYHHLFKRPDGRQVLFVYDKSGAPTVDIRLTSAGKRASAYDLKGQATGWGGFDGCTLSDVWLETGKVRIFTIDP